MGIFDRISTIMRSNINALLDRAEDPEKVLEQIIRDMESAMREARGQVAEMIAQEKRLKMEVDQSQRLSMEWQRKAELAVSKGSDDLAREALRRKRDYDESATIYLTQWTTQRDAVDKLKTQLRLLENKYEDAKRRRDVLIARHHTARAQQQVAQVSAGLTGLDPTSELARMEDRIQLTEARAQATTELAETSSEAQWALLEADGGVEDDLAALKARLQGPAPAGELPAAGGTSGGTPVDAPVPDRDREPTTGG